MIIWLKKLAHRWLFRRTLMISASHGTYCMRCRRYADPFERRHKTVPAQMGRNLPGERGCGKAWWFMNKDYYTMTVNGRFDEAGRWLRYINRLRLHSFMRPLIRIDLPFDHATTVQMPHPGF